MLEESIRAGVAMPTPEPAVPPPVPPENKELWNYMGSPTLLEAVEGKIVSQIEAEVVMEVASYERSYHYVSLAVGISPERVDELYQAGIRKLRRWLFK